MRADASRRGRSGRLKVANESVGLETYPIKSEINGGFTRVYWRSRATSGVT